GLLTGLRPMAEQYGVSVGALAVAWVLRSPIVTSAIVGARKQWQIEEMVGAAQVELSSSEVWEIESRLKGIGLTPVGIPASRI
ncbi:MAG TPA: aldo/keto reductase, partial [Bacteroidota bacterium]|nr:aldo/keto reductase [Bacteroidota bacterium]